MLNVADKKVAENQFKNMDTIARSFFEKPLEAGAEMKKVTATFDHRY